MTGVVYIDEFDLSRFSSYRIAKMEKIKFYPREKDRKNQEIIENVEEKTIDENE